MTSFAFEASGRLKPPSAGELAEADEKDSILAYTRGTMEDGTPYYAYVAVKPSKYQEFHARTVERRTMVLGDYGKVIAAGFEPEAPPEVVADMRQRYGIDDQYEEKLVQRVLKQQSVFVEKQETSRLQDIVSMLKSKKPNGSGRLN